LSEQHLGTHPPKTRLESLSDLVFGLALSIGALTLIGQQPTSSDQLLVSLVFYGFSFLILIQVWSEYSSTMTLLSVEARGVRHLNLFLLFLVSAEPFLFNLLTNPSVGIPLAMADLASILYALDIGTMHVILALFSHSVAIEREESFPVEARLYSSRRDSRALVAAMFAVSIFPVFWTWTIRLGEVDFRTRFVLWILTPVISIVGVVLMNQYHRLVSKLRHSMG
jgi:uncharacterized membrane protein